MIAMILSRNIAAVYSQTLTAISIFKYVNIVCIIQVHNRSCDFTAHMCTGMILSNYKLFVNPLFKLISILPPTLFPNSVGADAYQPYAVGIDDDQLLTAADELDRRGCLYRCLLPRGLLLVGRDVSAGLSRSLR